MAKFIKRIILFIILLVVLGVIAIAALMLFVSPNRFKPFIIEQVQKTTGRHLTMDGDLSWSFFPYLGLKVGHMSLSNPKNFSQKTFAEIDHATVAVKVAPLLHSRVETNGLTLSGVTLNLIKNAAGNTNWQDLSTPSASSEKTSTSSKSAATAFYLAIPSIDVSDVNINWIDEQAKKILRISDLELHAKNISFAYAFPIETKFNFAAKESKLSGKFSLDGNINLSNQQYRLQGMRFSSIVHQDQNDAKLKGNLDLDFSKQVAHLTNLVVDAAGITAQGQADISELLSEPKVLGNFRIDELTLQKFKASHVRFTMQFQKGMLQIDPITADLYQGKLQSQAKVDLNGAAPQIFMQTTVTSVQAEPLFDDLSLTYKKLKIKGAGDIKFTITTAGTDKNTILRNLQGSGNFSFKNGIVDGIDIAYYVDTARALLKKESPNVQDSKQTPFGTLTGTVLLHSGILTNNDLLMDAPRIETKGDGTINLVNETIDYTVQTRSKQKDENDQKNDLWHIYGLIIPVHITGSLQNPHISLDTNAILKQAVKKEVEKVQEKVKDKIKDQLKDQLKDKVSGKAGELLNNFLGH